jgi:hypothetical protein
MFNSLVRIVAACLAGTSRPQEVIAITITPNLNAYRYYWDVELTYQKHQNP